MIWNWAWVPGYGPIGVGSCIVDFCVSVARLPGRGETVLADSVTRSLGGKGANQATALRRLGGEVAIVGCVGRDDFGEAFLELFWQEGIETGFVHRDRSASQAASDILHRVVEVS